MLRHIIISVLALGLLSTLAPLARAAEATNDSSSPVLSDPANVQPAPPGSVGQVTRAADLDVRPGFRNPPPGFGIVPFYWWLGDTLTKERLGWELDRLSGMGLSGLQINYGHSDRGGRSYGLTLPSDPPLFSPEWWKLVGWLMKEAKPRGMALSLSDYTLGVGQGWCMDEVLREHPELTGMRLKLVESNIPADALCAAEVTGPGSRPRRVAVVAERVPLSYDALHPQSGPEYIKKFFGRFEEHFPGEGGKGLNFFFSDELNFGVGGNLWTPRFAAEFKRRKGYDLLPELPALFLDIGPRTPKIRLDYHDVMVSLIEEGYFKPIFDWHQARGMTMGCDHGGRGRNVVEFGDYFRTQRWMQGPGCDQPHLGKDLIKAKVASSIAHLYERPRVWLEGYYGSGWGTTPAGLVDATFADFVMGHNLLSFHGLYYSTHGGWWEWAPPCNGFHMPYWRQMHGFTDCVQRLSYLLSEGHHRCDVAILYPVAAMEAGMGGDEAVHTAFDATAKLYHQGIDFDFIDFQSLARAKVQDKELRVSGEAYRVLVLPAMRAVRHSTLEKAREFHRGGGIVLALGALPEASDRRGRDDPEVAAIVKEVFPQGAVGEVVSHLRDRDFEPPAELERRPEGAGYVMHRKLGLRDLYALYNIPKDTPCKFRATGRVELWDPWTGGVSPLPVRAQKDGFTQIALPLSDREIQLIVFSPGKAEIQSTPPPEMKTLAVEGDWEFQVQPVLDNRFGDYHWPPTPTLIGPEVRQLEYRQGDEPSGHWQKITCSFGPQFWKLGPVKPLASEESIVPDSRWKPCEFSWRWGIEGDPGHQGYHGLKEEVHDEFLSFGRMKMSMTDSLYEREGDGMVYYLGTTLTVPRATTAYALTGALRPARVWLDGREVKGDPLPLHAGNNRLLLRYDSPGRTYFVVSTQHPMGPPRLRPSGLDEQPNFKLSPLAMRWWNDSNVIGFDIRPEEKTPVGWYRFTSPPGLKAMTVTARGCVRAWVNDKPCSVRSNEIAVAEPSPGPAAVRLRIEQDRGCYGGAALPEPIRLDCGPGRTALGDWSKNDGLYCYSGAAWYRKTIDLPAAGQVVLDLGAVAATAEVRVNGQPAGVRVSPPWRFDISKLTRPGANRIEVLVHNTLANHYTTVPTRYRGDTLSGLLGPVSVQIK